RRGVVSMGLKRYVNGRKSAAIVAVLTLSSFPGLAAEADALAISAIIRARHFPFATVLDPVFSAGDSDQIVGYTHCGDSALWTGHFLAAEAFRYKVTRAPEALDNVKWSNAG